MAWIDIRATLLTLRSPKSPDATRGIPQLHNHVMPDWEGR
jgi:hypothetical protein